MKATPLAIRAHPLVLGTVLFLASELMFFASLFAAFYTLRAQTRPWPPSGVHLDRLDASIGTGLLALSSLVTALASRALNRGNDRAAHGWLFAAASCAIGFVGISLSDYAKSGFGIASHVYGTLYYTLTGFHLAHVAAGIALLLGLFFGMRSPALAADRRAGFEAISYYWHFVFVVWIGVFASIFVLQ